MTARRPHRAGDWFRILPIREEPAFALLPLYARALEAELRKIADDGGRIALDGRDPAEVICKLGGATIGERRQVRRDVALLLQKGFLRVDGPDLIVVQMTSLEREPCTSRARTVHESSANRARVEREPCTSFDLSTRKYSEHEGYTRGEENRIEENKQILPSVGSAREQVQLPEPEVQTPTSNPKPDPSSTGTPPPPPLAPLGWPPGRPPAKGRRGKTTARREQPALVDLGPAEAPPDPLQAPDVTAVLEHWRSREYHARIPLDLPDRRKRIADRLGERRRGGETPAVAVQTLKAAIDGASLDPWLMGTDPQSSKRYTGVETILRDASQVEKLAGLWDAALASGEVTTPEIEAEKRSRRDALRLELYGPPPPPREPPPVDPDFVLPQTDDEVQARLDALFGDVENASDVEARYQAAQRAKAEAECRAADPEGLALLLAAEARGKARLAEMGDLF